MEIIVIVLIIWFVAGWGINKSAKAPSNKHRRNRIFAGSYIVSALFIIFGIWYYFYDIRTCTGWGCLFAGLIGALIAIFGTGLLIIVTTIHIIRTVHDKKKGN